MDRKANDRHLTDTMNNIWNNIINIGPPELDNDSGSVSTSATSASIDGINSTGTPTARTTTSTVNATGTISTDNNSLNSLLQSQSQTKEQPKSGIFSTFSSNSSISSNPNSKQDPVRRPSNSWISQSFSDKFIERLIDSTLPIASVNLDVVSRRRTFQKLRPPISVQVTAKHYRSFQTRCGIFFESYYYFLSIITWENPSATLTLLSIYSFMCLNPRLIAVFPLLYLSLVIMVPAYVVRHPGPKSSSSPLDRYSIPADGLPLCEAIIPKPVPEFSKDFYMNILDTQNSMGDFIESFDSVVDWLASFAYFVDEKWSSFIYLSILLSSLVIYFTIPYVIGCIPWTFLLITVPWLSLGMNYFKEKNVEKVQIMKDKKDEIISHIEDHPKVKQKLDNLKDTYTIIELHNFVESQFDYISPHEQREVQVFEIQQFDSADNCWSSSIYHSTPYAHMKLPSEPLPAYCPSTLVEIRPPQDWVFISDQWNLDYNPHDWADLFCLQYYVFIDGDEKWVYDGSNGVKLNTWRRRRWIRLCSRKIRTAAS